MVSSGWPIGSVSPRSTKLRRRSSSGSTPSSAREPVHLTLVAERHLHAAEAAHRAAGRVVGVHGAGADADVGAAVGARRAGGRIQQHQGAEQGVGAAVGEDVDVHRHQAAVGVGAGAVAHPHRMAILARLQRLLAAPDHARRAAGERDHDPEVGLDRHVLLAAEAAADVGGDQPHLVVGQVEDPGDVAEVLDHLGRGADRDHAVGVAPGDAGLGLEVGVVDELGPVLLLDHRRGARDRGLGVALLELPVREQVAALVDLRRVGVERALGVVDDRQRLVVDLDRVQRRERRVVGLGGDQGDRLAVVADDPVGEHVRARLQRPDLERLAGDVDPDRVPGTSAAV